MEPAPIDYSQFVLTGEEQSLFDRFKESDTAVLTLAEYQILYYKRLILPEIDGIVPIPPNDIQSGTCELSQRGKELRVYQDALHKAENTARFRFWVPVGISVGALAVAIASFVLSLIALLQNQT